METETQNSNNGNEGFSDFGDSRFNFWRKDIAKLVRDNIIMDDSSPGCAHPEDACSLVQALLDSACALHLLSVGYDPNQNNGMAADSLRVVLGTTLMGASRAYVAEEVKEAIDEEFLNFKEKC